MSANPVFDAIRPYLPLLIPVIALQFILMIAALIDLFKEGTVTRGPRWVWALVIVLGELLGPIAYFVFGRKEE
jgi:hypothetical protein